jgi:hypothetical protein
MIVQFRSLRCCKVYSEIESEAREAEADSSDSISLFDEKPGTWRYVI